MKRLLLLVPTTSYRVGDFLAAAHRLGVDVAVGSGRPQVLERHGRTVTVDFADPEKGVRQIVAYAGRYPLLAIVPTDDETTHLAALASRALGLPHNTPESVEAAGNKFRFRTVLANSGLAAPKFSLYSTGDDPERLADEAGYPAVLKPLAMSASRGVIRVDGRDEFIAAFKELWSSDTPTFEGAYTRFANIAFAPKPVQRPHPPIWIGGESGPAMKRTVRLADGWYPIGNNPRFPMNTVGRFADGVQKLRGFAEEAGRDPAEIDLAFFAPRYNESEAQILDDGARQAFTGSAEEIAADIAGFRDSGLRHLVLNFLDPSLERTLERMAFFAETVRPLAGD